MKNITIILTVLLVAFFTVDAHAQSEAFLEQISKNHDREITEKDIDVISKQREKKLRSKQIMKPDLSQGPENRADVIQNGYFNLADIMQIGKGNRIQLLQDGSYNTIELTQNGNGNNFTQSTTGDYNSLDAKQIGNDNNYNMEFQGSHTDHSVRQEGNNISATQSGQTSNPFGITQRGNDMNIIINHRGF
ncbi:MAG: hypothetical protein WD037_14290 [Balneolales bacterium]